LKKPAAESNKEPIPPIRPGLDDFLSALDSFLVQKPTKKEADPGLLKFLGIFCRTIGANDGHFVKGTTPEELESVFSIGMGKGFDAEFNAVHAESLEEPAPIDTAVLKREVVAVVDISKDPELPAWFKSLMEKYKIDSMVAVPLMGSLGPVGVFCVYYHDVCLFDQGTLDHLMMIGRMVGAATEKPGEWGHGPSSRPDDGKALDRLLAHLNDQPLSRIKIFEFFMEAVKNTADFSGAVCGPVRKSGNHYSVTVACGTKIPLTVITKAVSLPAFLIPQLGAIHKTGEIPGDLKPLLPASAKSVIYIPLKWQKGVLGMLVGWRLDGRDFQNVSTAALERLAGTASLAIQTIL